VALAQSPAAVESEILNHLKDIASSGTYTGEYDETKNNQANEALKQTLIRNSKRLDILKYSFPKLRDEMFIATSPDGKLRIYSWDLQTGGTMHDYSSVFQYQGKNGAIYTKAEDADDESAGAFWTQIFQLGSSAVPIYIANSTFIGQSNIHGQSIEILRIVGEKLERPKLIRTRSGLQNSVDFIYDPYSLRERPERLVFYSVEKQTFGFPVVIEDKEFGNGRVTDRFIIYRFNGQYFVKAN
jgi:hypothetical protein